MFHFRKKEDKINSSIISDSNDFKEALDKDKLSIESLSSDIEKKLQEQGVIFDKKKFFVQERHMTYGERLADSVARIGGSWTFIVSFGIFLMLWIVINAIWLSNHSWDPYPFILLNLILSCLASVQAPIIMMSQNRQAEKERKQQEINLEKDIVDFKQDRLDVILDQKETEILIDIRNRLARIEKRLDDTEKRKKRK